LLRAEDVSTAIIFCNRKTTVRELAKSLQQHRFRASEIHGDMDQSSRLKELDRFKSGDINILVASDVAARGLDIKGVSHVFNFDVPWHPDDYVHRIGRTGRAGAKGKAFTLITKEDEEAIANIEKLTSTKIERMAALAEPEREEEERPAARERTPRERAPRDAREARPAREPREARPAREPRAERTPRAPRPDREAAPRKQNRYGDPFANDPPDDGWNGPVPDFLAVGFN
jgi:superfamily II DNA/RNA helicase